MPRAIATTLALIVLASSLSGCNSQQKQQEKHDAEFRQHVEELKKKSNAYPVNGSSNHYIP